MKQKTESKNLDGSVNLPEKKLRAMVILVSLLFPHGLLAHADKWEEYIWVCEWTESVEDSSAYFTIVHKKGTEEMIREEPITVINRFMSDGWQPLGGLSVRSDNPLVYFLGCQAMVR